MALFQRYDCIEASNSKVQRPWEADSRSANQEIPAFYDARRFITLSWSSWIQTTSLLHISLTSVLTLFYHLSLGLPSFICSPGFRTKILYAFLISFIRATCPVHLILFDLIILIMCREVWKLWSSSLWNSPYPPVTSFLLVSNILLITLFSNALSLIFFS
jgi:hypothetical protein